MRTLHICTIYPDKPSIYTMLNYILLEELIGNQVNLMKNYVRCDIPFKKGVGDDSIQIGYRNQYLDKIQEGDFMLILDDDEQLAGNIGMIPDMMSMMVLHQKQVTNISEIRYDFDKGNIFYRPRLLLMRKSLQYLEKHNRMDNEDGVNIIHHDYQEVINCPSIIFSHHKTILKATIKPIANENSQKL